MPYKIYLTKAAVKDIAALPANVTTKLDEQILALTKEPFPPNSRKLKGHKTYYRLRIGSYRVLYVVDADEFIITIARAGNRKDIYRGL